MATSTSTKFKPAPLHTLQPVGFYPFPLVSSLVTAQHGSLIKKQVHNFYSILLSLAVLARFETFKIEISSSKN